MKINGIKYIIIILLSTLLNFTIEAADYACFSTAYTTEDRLKPAVNVKLYANNGKYDVDSNMFNLQTESILTIGTVGSFCSSSSSIINYPTVNLNSNTIVNSTVYPNALGEAQFTTTLSVSYDLKNVTCKVFYQNANSTVSEVSCGYFILTEKCIKFSLTLLILLFLLV